MRKKNFKMGTGKYYFHIRSGQQNIVITRDNKEEASNAFYYYKRIGKNCEWLGCWDGKNFTDTSIPLDKAA